MDPTFVKVDYVARCIDNAVYIGLGMAVLLIAPRQIRRKHETGKITEAKARTMSKVVWPLGCLMIGYGIFKIFIG
ncbi:MAG: hypothetical protein WBW41_15260 [Verrucomicrobiia bacterium]